MNHQQERGVCIIKIIIKSTYNTCFVILWQDLVEYIYISISMSER